MPAETHSACSVLVLSADISCPGRSRAKVGRSSPGRGKAMLRFATAVQTSIFTLRERARRSHSQRRPGVRRAPEPGTGRRASVLTQRIMRHHARFQVEPRTRVVERSPRCFIGKSPN
jgi:hypothetical protein